MSVSATRLAEKHKPFYQAIFLAYHTGLRPSEVYRITPDDFNHNALTLTVHVRKTKRSGYDRVIAIPQTLSTWAVTARIEHKTSERSTRHLKG